MEVHARESSESGHVVANADDLTRDNPSPSQSKPFSTHPSKNITCQRNPTMNPSELAARLVKGEDLHTEFKERLIHADDLAASIIAFANTDGGQMIFGVNDE